MFTTLFTATCPKAWCQSIVCEPMIPPRWSPPTGFALPNPYIVHSPLPRDLTTAIDTHSLNRIWRAGRPPTPYIVDGTINRVYITNASMPDYRPGMAYTSHQRSSRRVRDLTRGENQVQSRCSMAQVLNFGLYQPITTRPLRPDAIRSLRVGGTDAGITDHRNIC